MSLLAVNMPLWANICLAIAVLAPVILFLIYLRASGPHGSADGYFKKPNPTNQNISMGTGETFERDGIQKIKYALVKVSKLGNFGEAEFRLLNDGPAVVAIWENPDWAIRLELDATIDEETEANFNTYLASEGLTLSGSAKEDPAADIGPDLDKVQELLEHVLLEILDLKPDGGLEIEMWWTP